MTLDEQKDAFSFIEKAFDECMQREAYNLPLYDALVELRKARLALTTYIGSEQIRKAFIVDDYLKSRNLPAYHEYS